MMIALPVALFMAAGSVTAVAQNASAPPAADEAPQLIKSLDVKPGDSPLVQAAKRAVAARLNPKDRLKVTVKEGQGRGRVSQSTGPVDVSFNVPSSTDPTPATQPAQRPRRTFDTSALEARLKELLAEQERLGAQTDEPYGGDGSEEDHTDTRLDQLRKEIQDLNAEIARQKGQQ
jgi:hypothetical protein